LNSDESQEFFNKFTQLHPGINLINADIKDETSEVFNETTLQKLFRSMYYFDEYLFANFYNTDKYKLDSTDPRPIGHLHLLTTNSTPEFNNQNITKRIYMIQFVFEST